MRLFFIKVSHKRTDLQDDSRWPFPVMPYLMANGPKTVRHEDWWIVKSGPGWTLNLAVDRRFCLRFV